MLKLFLKFFVRRVGPENIFPKKSNEPASPGS